jgi:NDP-sugar pyrophosphorylase family protein
MGDLRIKAMILAAGKGTRLGALTQHCPKALVEVAGKPLLAHVLEKLMQFGIKDFVVNVHHHADQITEYLQQNFPFANIAISDERDALLDTGGGVQKAAPLLEGADILLVHNVDILSDLDPGKMIQHHLACKADATLAVRQRNTSRYLLFDHNLKLQGWINKSSGERIPADCNPDELQEFAFSGIQIINPALLKNMQRKGPYSLIHWYLELCKEKNIAGYLHQSDYWNDVGKPEELKAAEDYYRSLKRNP